MLIRFLLFLAASSLFSVASAFDDHQHHHGAVEVVERPKVFLDKSPRIVEYQLKRLDNRRLLLVERSDDDIKYAPVHLAILVRPGIAQQSRDEAVHALARIRSTDVAQELLAAIGTLDANDREQSRVADLLTQMLVTQSEELLTSQMGKLEQAAQSNHSASSSAGFAGLITAKNSEDAWNLAGRDDPAKRAWLHAVTCLPSTELQAAQRERVLQLMDAHVSRPVLVDAMPVLAAITASRDDAFRRIAAFVNDSSLRPQVVQALLKIPDENRESEVCRTLVEVLVNTAEKTAAEDRTSDAFVDAMLLAEQLLRKVDTRESLAFRERMRAVSVRVVRIRTVHEEMRYDVPYFAVEAGRPVQIVLQNDDLMPHNLVITKTDALQQVATAGAELGPSPGFQGLPYVPQSDDVMFATNMVEAGKQVRLTFNAPTEVGEYPYVCTFPRHWMRMYGVMVVVDDLDAWQRSGVTPKDPLGNTRTFVRNWAVTDFGADFGGDLANRSTENGQKLFKEATCLQCHRMRNEGGAVGPDLTQVPARWKNDHRGVLREILDPSYKIDPKYVVQVVLLNDGKTLSGIVQTEDDKSIALIVNPERPEPQIIQKSDVEELIPSATSMMPKALLDKFTQDEVLDILKYITSGE